MPSYDVMACNLCPGNHPNSCQHKDSVEHRFNFAIYEYNTYRKKLLRDRHGIVFSIEPSKPTSLKLDFDYQERKGQYVAKILEEQLMLHDCLTFECSIKNNRSDVIYLMSANLLHISNEFSVIYNEKYPFGKNRETILALEPNSSYKFKVQFRLKEITFGKFLVPVTANFQTKQDEAFTIPRAILVAVTNSQDETEEIIKSPYTSQEWTNIVRTVPPNQKLHYTERFIVPESYKKYLKYGLEPFKNMTQADNAKLQEIQNLIGAALTPPTYRNYWHVTLWLEDVAQTLMLKKYNMENVTVETKQGNILVLEVPGLAEKRPSVIVGDFMVLRIHEDHTAYQGIVKRVNEKTVEIFYVNQELIDYIHSDPAALLDVAFIPSRLTFERMHEAVDKVSSTMIDALFPPKISLGNNLMLPTNHNNFYLPDSEFCYKSITQNPEQRNAVTKIITSTNKYPYIVFGPPGTGKTITIVEAILQMKNRTNKKILVCAPANSACDHIAIMLLPFCNRSELIRIHSDTRETSTLTEQLKGYSNMEEEGAFTKMSGSEIQKYRIVVTTLVLIGRYRQGYKPDCVFIDEAAQASEPETDVAIGFLEFGKQVVLAGDPKQLGPMVTSKCAEKYGLGTSLLERLMNDHDQYKPDKVTRSYNTDYISMLKLNFRSHSNILGLINKYFYGNNLRPCAQKPLTDPVGSTAIFPLTTRNQKKQRPKSGSAIEFCSIVSKERKEGHSPSYFNPEEVQMVLKYVQALTRLNFPDPNKVQAEDIGVITPYKRQVHKIKNILIRNGYGRIEVGTTETYQGREKRIIIISTVRAQHSLLLHDRKYNLGFVKNDKRFNVAITRAISKLIIIGSQHVLITDSKWKELIEDCIAKNSYFGAQYVERTSEWKEEVVYRMKHFKSKDDQYKHQHH